jgi:ribosomal protein S6
MNDNIKEGREAVYEIGYLIVSSIPEEKVSGEADSIKKIITDAGAVVIAEEQPHKEQLAYEMRKKTVSGAYDTYDEAYFGWVKFELESGKIEAVKKAIEVTPSVLRMLLITTVRDNTYLGKRASQAVAKAIAVPGAPAEEKKETAAPATIEEMDKSIDEMVKEV